MSGRFFHSKRSKLNTLLPARAQIQSAPAAAASPTAARSKPYKKGKIPKALREALWLKVCGKSFEVKCNTTWCQNRITAYDFQAGHNVPEARGGATTLDNLVPICSRCNLSMGSQYTFTEWCKLDGEAVAATQPSPVSPAAAAAQPLAAPSFWCCSASCVEFCIEPEDPPPEEPTVRTNPLPATKRPAQRRVSPGGGAPGPAVLVPSNV